MVWLYGTVIVLVVAVVGRFLWELNEILRLEDIGAE